MAVTAALLLGGQCSIIIWLMLHEHLRLLVVNCAFGGINSSMNEVWKFYEVKMYIKIFVFACYLVTNLLLWISQNFIVTAH